MLLTIFLPFYRPFIRYSLQGVQHLSNYLEHLTAEGIDRLDNNSLQLCCETLKIIFNLLLSNETSSAERPINLQHDKELQKKLVQFVRKIFLVESALIQKTHEELQR